MPDDQPVLVVIAADPRASHRAIEAMRIGVGIVAGENEVTFVLRGPAVHLLDADTDDLVDGDDIAKFRDEPQARSASRSTSRRERGAGGPRLERRAAIPVVARLARPRSPSSSARAGAFLVF